jgi:MoaA/NifB/PqqE/SkfB family radical SAM enzyme
MSYFSYHEKNDVHALVKMSYVCNNRCLFCHRADVRDKEKTFFLKKIIEEAKILGITTIELSGGEPTIQKNIIEVLLAIKREKMKLGLVSNGRMFSYNDFLEKVIALGVNFFFISLHSHCPAKHEFLTGTKKSWEQTVRGIKNITRHRSKPRLIVNCVVVNENINELKEIILFLKKKNVKNIKFSYPLFIGEIRRNRELMPPPNFAGEKISEALSFCEENKISGFYEGLPFCMIRDKYKTYVHSLERAKIYYVYEAFDRKFRGTIVKKKNKKIDCLECSYYSACVDYSLKDVSEKTDPVYEKIPRNLFFHKSDKNHPMAIFIEKEGFYRAENRFFMIKDIEEIKKKKNFFYLRKGKMFFLKRRKNVFSKSEELFYEKIEKKIENTMTGLKGKGLFITDQEVYKQKIPQGCVVTKKLAKIFQRPNSLEYIVLGESYNNIKLLRNQLNLFRLILKKKGKLIIFERNLCGILTNKKIKEKNLNYRNHSMEDCEFFLGKLGFKTIEKKDYKNIWKIIAFKK